MVKRDGRGAGEPAGASTPRRNRLGIVGIGAGLGACAIISALAPGALGAPRHHHQPANGSAATAGSGSRTTVASDPTPPPQPETTHKEGDYGGVDPDHPQSTDATAKPKPKHTPPKGTLSWVGFELKDGGSEIFFQSPGAFDIQQHVEGGQLVVELGSLSQLGANAWRPIDTHFFDNPIARIEARRVGAGVEVRITFKNAGDAREGSYRSEQETDGYYYAYLSFAGSGASPDAATVKDPEK
jgi:hypothetical protein